MHGGQRSVKPSIWMNKSTLSFRTCICFSQQAQPLMILTLPCDIRRLRQERSNLMHEINPAIINIWGCIQRLLEPLQFPNLGSLYQGIVCNPNSLPYNSVRTHLMHARKKKTWATWKIFGENALLQKPIVMRVGIWTSSYSINILVRRKFAIKMPLFKRLLNTVTGILWVQQ